MGRHYRRIARDCNAGGPVQRGARRLPTVRLDHARASPIRHPGAMRAVLAIAILAGLSAPAGAADDPTIPLDEPLRAYGIGKEPLTRSGRELLRSLDGGAAETTLFVAWREDCDACDAHLDRWHAAGRRLTDAHVVVLVDSEDAARALRARTSAPVALLSTAWSVPPARPVTLVVGRDGRVRATVEGSGDDVDAALWKALARAGTTYRARPEPDLDEKLPVVSGSAKKVMSLGALVPKRGALFVLSWTEDCPPCDAAARRWTRAVKRKALKRAGVRLVIVDTRAGTAKERRQHRKRMKQLGVDVPVLAAPELRSVMGPPAILRVDPDRVTSLALAESGDALAHVIGRFDEVLIAEAVAHRTPLVGKTLRENRLSELGVSVVGVWERGRFDPARPDTRITNNTVLVLAGSAEQLQNYDEHFCIYNVSGAPAVIIGGGRVGLATARALAERDVDYRIIEQDGRRVGRSDRYVVGNAAELEVLQAAGIMSSPTAIITTNDDNTNIYLTLYCRRLRPDIQIVSRATLERNLPTLHRAGADFVMSHTSMAANAVLNVLQRSTTVMLAEGLDVFKVRVPTTLAGQSLSSTSIRRDTGCSVIAIHDASGLLINPPPTAVLPPDGEIVLIGTAASEAAFYRAFGAA